MAADCSEVLSEVVDGVRWYYCLCKRKDGGFLAYICSGEEKYAGDLVVPSVLGGACVFGIEGGAFSGCSDLTSIVLPARVDIIASQTFQNCTSLATIQMPDAVTLIGDYAFAGCISLSRISIPERCKIVGFGAFVDCKGLKRVFLPKSTSSVSSDAFEGCESLTAIDVDGENPRYTSIDGVWYNKDATELIRCPMGREDNVSIPQSVSCVSRGAFSGCHRLGSGTKVIDGCVVAIDDEDLTWDTIPEGVRLIGGATFAWQQGIERMSIPNGVKIIGNQAFQECENLKEVFLPESVEIIGSQAFYGCTNLKSVNIGSNVLRIGVNAFSGCKSLGEGVVVIDGCVLCVNGECPSHLQLPDDVRLIGDGVFSERTELVSAEMPDGVRTIGNETFFRCLNLRSVKIPPSVVRIGDRAFCGCRALKAISVPESVLEIGELTFYGCVGGGIFNEFFELTPDWLLKYTSDGALDVEAMFSGNSLFWTEAADVDNRAPIRLLNKAHAAHLFIYASCHYLNDRCERDRNFRGYRMLDSRPILMDKIAPMSAGGYEPVVGCGNEPTEAMLRIYERLPEYGEEHGARRFAFLELAGDTIDLYRRIYFENKTRRVPLLVGVGDHSGKTPFGIDYKKHHVLKGGREGWDARWKPELERLISNSGIIKPEFMYALGRDTKPWEAYVRVKDAVEEEKQLEDGRLYCWIFANTT